MVSISVTKTGSKAVMIRSSGVSNFQLHLGARLDTFSRQKQVSLAPAGYNRPLYDGSAEIRDLSGTSDLALAKI